MVGAGPGTPRAIRYECRRPGKSVIVYEEWLVVDRPDVKVLLLDHYDGTPVTVGPTTVLDAGAPIVWCLFPDTWHEIGRFHRADGTFTGWYTNLTSPVEFAGESHWSSTDMFLDLWNPVGGGACWLDEDEFDAAVAAGTIDAGTTRRVLAERALLEARVRTGDWPPSIARDFDLARARRLAGAG